MKLSGYMLLISAFIPAAFGRLCVETLMAILSKKQSQPAAFGRLCVETGVPFFGVVAKPSSRLRAAVC